jgi:adenylylsulfate kinase-like enzyme
MNDAGLWLIVALISPKKTAQENARSIIGERFF